MIEYKASNSFLFALQHHSSLRKLALSLALMGVWCAGRADVTRNITLASDQQVSVRLDWSFNFEPSACLIVEENVTPGWHLVGFHCSLGSDIPVRESGYRFSFAVGLLTATPSRGALTYLLAPDAGGAATLSLTGSWSTAFEATHFTFATGGDVVAPLAPLSENKHFRVWATAVGLPSDADSLTDSDGDGFSNYEEYVAQTNPRDASSRFHVTAWRLSTPGQGLNIAWFGATNRQVFLEWRPSVGTGADWRCVWTSTPLNRVERSLAPPVDSVVSESPPITPMPGFYRLRINQP